MNTPTPTAKPSEIFRQIYQSGLWGKEKWNSGTGSDPNAEGRPYCFLIPPLLKVLDAKTVCDLGCGDGRILASIASDCPEIRFIGIDCCEELIHRLKKRLPHHYWLVNELATVDDFEEIPEADVYLCKDVFHHWPSDRIAALIDHLKAQGKGLLIATQDRHQGEATDCPLGGYRALNGAMQPWNMFQPQLLANYLHKACWLLRF